VERFTILIVDDHAAVRAAVGSLARYAFPGCAVIECGSAAHGLAAARAHWPALAIIDVSLPDMNGLELMVRMRESVPGLSVLVISQHPASIYAARAHTLGARGFISKERLHEDLLPAIAQVIGPPPPHRGA
jgi:DNA-binding NarL/FixJ family response regulator